MTDAQSEIQLQHDLDQGNYRPPRTAKRKGLNKRLKKAQAAAVRSRKEVLDLCERLRRIVATAKENIKSPKPTDLEFLSQLDEMAAVVEQAIKSVELSEKLNEQDVKPSAMEVAEHEVWSKAVQRRERGIYGPYWDDYGDYSEDEEEGDS